MPMVNILVELLASLIATKTATAEQYDRRIPFAGAVDVERPPTDVDRAANLRETVSVLGGFGLFVRRSERARRSKAIDVRFTTLRVRLGHEMNGIHVVAA